MGTVPKLGLSLAHLAVGALFIAAGAIVLATLLGALTLALPFSATVAWVVVGLTMGIGSILILDILARPGFNFVKDSLTLAISTLNAKYSNYKKPDEVKRAEAQEALKAKLAQSFKGS